MYYCYECQKIFDIPVRAICTWEVCSLCDRKCLVNQDIDMIIKCKHNCQHVIKIIHPLSGKLCKKCKVCGKVFPIKKVDPNDKQL